MRVVVSDTSPIRYLALIDEAELLARLYGKVVAPRAVHQELSHPKAPPEVRQLITSEPDWLEVSNTPLREPETDSSLQHLDHGEREAILLAELIGADLVLMDDRDGVEEARCRAIAVTGTLGVLVAAADHGFIDLPNALRQLRETNFRVSPSLLQKLIDR